MLKNPTKDKLRELNLQGMTSALEEQLDSTQYDELTFEDRLGLLIDREIIHRENKRISLRLRQSKLSGKATMADIQYSRARGIDKSFMLRLADWSFCQMLWMSIPSNCV